MSKIKRKKKMDIVKKYDSPIRLAGGKFAMFPKAWTFHERCEWIRNHAKTTQLKKHLNLHLPKLEEDKK